ncbi:LysM-like peptidoglycan-binding domain-containing protein [Vibrio hippocampi]|uniref:Opacity-associated protein A LysM-like domain-containing protein n=1 Tax=Vibrio hippocampi TaxID=654686 RepID=A0ABM8ZF13_9VIBR|nr:LysM-like peptidoglycan-binding domain-containing protein [Vibrio hippocampi]CAH0524522.1 hypothetical protein VHP8226_00359 [Vibrio hippocampi]
MNRRNKPQTEPLSQRFSRWCDTARTSLSSNASSTPNQSRSFRTFWHNLPIMHQRILMVVVPLYLLVILLPSEMFSAKQQPSAQERVEVSVSPRSLAETDVEIVTETPAEPQWKEYTVKKGDTLAQVFRVNRISMADLNALAQIEGEDKPLSRIKQGQLIRFKYDVEGKLDILQIEKGTDSVMFFRLSDGGFGRSK